MNSKLKTTIASIGIVIISGAAYLNNQKTESAVTNPNRSEQVNTTELKEVSSNDIAKTSQKQLRKSEANQVQSNKTTTTKPSEPAAPANQSTGDFCKDYNDVETQKICSKWAIEDKVNALVKQRKRVVIPASYDYEYIDGDWHKPHEKKIYDKTDGYKMVCPAEVEQYKNHSENIWLTIKSYCYEYQEPKNGLIWIYTGKPKNDYSNLNNSNHSLDQACYNQCIHGLSKNGNGVAVGTVCQKNVDFS